MIERRPSAFDRSALDGRTQKKECGFRSALHNSQEGKAALSRQPYTHKTRRLGKKSLAECQKGARLIPRALSLI
jgi:hypothetical protein